ncbi:linear amide C-N hydrolase [Advenella sp. RU8]|uniref:linear amide C-N hydrolase n=1 Tax=Advenella sp. RU8 TaxID=3399575 RepID=UPI003AAB9039
MLVPSVGQACTSLMYIDANGTPYTGRTLELSMELPYKVAYFPTGTTFGSKADQHHVLDFTTKHAFVSIGIPNPANAHEVVIQGLNDKGLTLGLLSFPNADGPAEAVSKTTAILAAIDLGAWALSQFDSVAAVKEVLKKQPVMVTALLPNDQLKTPFHYTVHDASGKSIVIEQRV